MTPPALAGVSGTPWAPRPAGTAPPAAVVGPLAAPTTIPARMRGALLSVPCPSMAAGTRMSTGSSSSSAFVMSSWASGCSARRPPATRGAGGESTAGPGGGGAALRRAVGAAAARRLAGAAAAADAGRLARDDAGHGVAVVHAVGIHDPGHDAGVRAHVRRRDVAIRAEEDADLGGVAAGEALQLAL